MVIDRYVYNPEQGTGEVALTATRAALHFTTGKLKHLRNKSITVDTPVAALAVRGTVFWAGIIDYQYGVLLLEGKLNVSNSAGSEDISLPNHGIDFPPVLKEASSISDPYEWDAAKIQRARWIRLLLLQSLHPSDTSPRYLFPTIRRRRDLCPNRMLSRHRSQPYNRFREPVLVLLVATRSRSWRQFIKLDTP